MTDFVKNIISVWKLLCVRVCFCVRVFGCVLLGYVVMF